MRRAREYPELAASNRGYLHFPREDARIAEGGVHQSKQTSVVIDAITLLDSNLAHDLVVQACAVSPSSRGPSYAQ